MIPATCHFVWLGTSFPFVNALAVLSAAQAGGFERVVLHTSDDLEPSPYLDRLFRLPGFTVRRIDLGALARGADQKEDAVRALFANMTSAAARSDVVRALLLAGEGGVYLDTDTVTVSAFDSLREHGAFVGQEVICFPEWSTTRHSPSQAALAYGKSALRLCLRFLPQGHRAFSRIAHHYSLAVNNAVLGAEPGHPFIRAYLDAMLAEDPAQARRRYAIGPELLARVCREQAGSGLLVLPPEYFYPLGPVISEVWWSTLFPAKLSEVVTPKTVVVHWYASVRNRDRSNRVDPAYLEAHQGRQLFADLAAPYLPSFR